MKSAIFSVGLKYAIARLREPSTYAGVAGMLAAAHIAAPGWAPAAVQIAGVALASIVSLAMGEKPKA
jgi:hypothetical protein